MSGLRFYSMGNFRESTVKSEIKKGTSQEMPCCLK